MLCVCVWGGVIYYFCWILFSPAEDPTMCSTLHQCNKDVFCWHTLKPISAYFYNVLLTNKGRLGNIRNVPFHPRHLQGRDSIYVWLSAAGRLTWCLCHPAENEGRRKQIRSVASTMCSDSMLLVVPKEKKHTQPEPDDIFQVRSCAQPAAAEQLIS